MQDLFGHISILSHFFQFLKIQNWIHGILLASLSWSILVLPLMVVSFWRECLSWISLLIFMHLILCYTLCYHGRYPFVIITLINFINFKWFRSHSILSIHSKSYSRNEEIGSDEIVNLIWNLLWACGMHKCCSFHFHSCQRCRTLHQWMKNIPTVRICLADQCKDGCLDLWISAASHWIDISPVIESS